jgi:hypothetical protein
MHRTRAFNPHALNWGVNYPATTLFAAISEPLGISERALATSPEYELTTRRRFQTKFVAVHKSKMEAGKQEMI